MLTILGIFLVVYLAAKYYPKYGKYIDGSDYVWDPKDSIKKWWNK
jgi:hypothetical protein